MQNIPTTNNGAVNGDNTNKTRSTLNGNGKKIELSIVILEGVEYITDGRDQYPVKRGPYSLKQFINPSGEVKVQLDGYRPANAPSGQEVLPLGRVRSNFDTLRQANAERKAQILADGNSESVTDLVETTLSEAEVRDAEAAKVIMSGLPAAAWEASAWSFLQLARYVEKHFKPCRAPKALTDAVAQFMKDEKDANLKFATKDSKQSMLNRLIKACSPGISVHEVPIEVIKTLIYAGTKRKSWKKNKSNLNTFFAWAAHEDQGHIAESPVQRIILKKKKDDYHVPKILKNEEVLKLLTAAQKFKGGKLFLFCALGIVTALRPAELARITALQKVLGIGSFRFSDLENECVVSVIGKTRMLRDVVFPPEFLALINIYVEAGYPVLARNFAHDWTVLRAQVGYLGRKDLLPAHLFSDDLEPWTHDVLRHVGITHYLNRTKNEHATALWAGDSPKMIFHHYKGKATEAETREFYAIAGKLSVPTVNELKAAGVPDCASDSELKRLKCPVDDCNTFFMDEKKFKQARARYIKICPEAAKPEIKGPRRGKDMWTKRRMLDLPKELDEQIRLVWTKDLSELAQEHKVARSTMALALEDMGLPAHLFPPKGCWQQRAAGKAIALPPEVQKVFPDGLPTITKPVGRQIRLERPSLPLLLRLVWEKKADDITVHLTWSKSTVEREIRKFHLPRPEATYWLLKPAQRQIPADVKLLLKLDEAKLKAELAKRASSSS